MILKQLFHGYSLLGRSLKFLFKEGNVKTNLQITEMLFLRKIVLQVVDVGEK